MQVGARAAILAGMIMFVPIAAGSAHADDVADRVAAEAAANAESMQDRSGVMDDAITRQFRAAAEGRGVGTGPVDGRWAGLMTLESGTGENCAMAYRRTVTLGLVVAAGAVSGEAVGRGAGAMRLRLDGAVADDGSWSAQGHRTTDGTAHSLSLEGNLKTGSGVWRDPAARCSGSFLVSRAE